MSKNLGKWIGSNEINGDKIRLANEQALRARNAAGTVDINLLKLSSSDLVEFLTEPTYNGSPTYPYSLTNRQYVLDVIAGIRDMKDAVRAAAVTLPAFTAAGTGLGKTLTGDANGELEIDGVTDLIAGERIGVIGEGINNGIYVLTQQGTAGLPYILTRATDADSNSEVTQGLSFDVSEGTANGKTRWLLTTKVVDIDVTTLTFVETPVAATVVQFKEEAFTLTATDITNQYIDLANDANVPSIIIWPVGGPVQQRAVDWSNSVVADVTRISFQGDLASSLVAGDTLIVNYSHF
jgi:hypothetical protein